MTIADQVRRVIAQHLGVDPDTITDEARFREDLGPIRWMRLSC